MATKPVPTADLIRAQLRRMRNVAGMSQEDYGKRAHYSGSQVSAVELGQRPLDEVYLTRADEIFETGGLFVAMLELAKRDGEPTWFRPWLEGERNATQLRCFHPTLIGLSGPLVLGRSADGGWVGHLDDQLGGHMADRTEDVETLLATWESVRNDALPSRQSLDLIKEIVRPWI